MALKHLFKIMAGAVVAAALSCTITPEDDGARKLFDVPGASENNPNPTSDGKYILFTEFYDIDNEFTRYLSLYELGTGEITRLTDDDYFRGGDLAISPDGKHIACSIDDDIYILPWGAGEPTKLTFSGINRVRCWNPDSASLVYGSWTGDYHLKEKDIYTMEERVLLTEFGKSFGTAYYSPDGSYMLVTINDNMDWVDYFEIAIYDTATWDKKTVLYTSTDDPICYYSAGPWSPDGNRFLMANTGDEDGRYITSYNLKTGRIVPITYKSRSLSTNFRWSPDGTRIYFEGGPVGEHMPDEGGIYVIGFPD
jgi:Tol biopolymer transport system component